MNDINLLKDFYRPRKTIRITLFIFVAAAVAALFSYFGIVVPLREKHELALMASNFSQMNGEYESIEKEYTELSKRMEELREKASGINPLIAGRQWSEVFTLLEQAIPQGAALRSLSYDGDAVVLEGIATDDVEIARFIVNLKKTGLFSTVSLKRIDGDEGGQLFLMNCKFNPLDHK